VPKLDAQHGTSHAVVGMMVARNWQLPDEVAQAIRHHHDRRPEALPEHVRALCVLIQFACHALVLRMGGDDSEWEGVWKAHAEALFRHAGHELGEIEQELLSLSL
jgi:HD-like signal output (HDOD) protein